MISWPQGQNRNGSMDNLRQDVHHAVRQFVKNPAFAVLAAFTLALGIGANTAIFSVVNGVVLRPLPYPEPERVHYLGWDLGSGPVGALSAFEYQYWRENSHVFDGVATMRSVDAEVATGDHLEEVQGLRVTEDFLRVIGLPPVLGRDFLAEEVAPGGPLATILGYNFWRSRFGGDPAVIGSTIRIDGAPYTVVGVLPPNFRYVPEPDHGDLLLPLQLHADPGVSGRNYEVLVRLSDSVTTERANADMAVVFERFRREHPELVGQNERGAGFMSFQDLYVGNLQRTLWVLLGAVGLVLLIACVNVANLLLARATSRRREIATRLALGAGRWRIISQLLTESTVLALIGSAVGLVIGLWSLDILLTSLPQELPRMDEIGLDVRVLSFTLGASLVTGLVLGLAAGLPTSRTELTMSLKEGAHGEGGHRGLRARGALVAGEVALSVILLAGAGLLITSFVRLRSADIGFSPQDVVTVNLGRTPDGYDTGTRVAEIERQLVGRLRGGGGVTAVATASSLPLQRGMNIPMELQGRPGEGETAIEWRAVGPEYFSTLAIPVRGGRAFTEFDLARAAPVAIINEATARHYWPDSDPIGQRILIGRWEGRPVLRGEPDPPREIVGVVGNVRDIALDRPPRRTVYVPTAQVGAAMFDGLPRVMVRTTHTAEAMAAVRQALREIDPRFREPRFSNMSDVVASTTAQRRFNTLLIASFAGLALVLTIVGIFGVVSYSVRQRTHEIGIRMALGAGGRQVRRLIIWQGMRAVALGLAVGLFGAFGLTRFMAGMLYGVTPTDPTTFASVSALLAGVAFLASYVPSHRATRVDPMRALKVE